MEGFNSPSFKASAHDAAESQPWYPVRTLQDEVARVQRRLAMHHDCELVREMAVVDLHLAASIAHHAEDIVMVVMAILSPSGVNSGVGFAIPVDVVNRIVPELIRNGHVPTPGIGIVAADESTTAQLGVEGVVLVQVVPGSPAARAGLRGLDPSTEAVGDVIVAANGTPVRRLADLTDQLEKAGVGNAVDPKVQSGGSTKTVHVEVRDVGRQ